MGIRLLGLLVINYDLGMGLLSKGMGFNKFYKKPGIQGTYLGIVSYDGLAG